MLVGGLVDGLDFISAEDERVDCPVGMLDIVDLGGHRGHNAKVVTCAIQGPPEVGFGINRLQTAVGEDDIGGNELIRNQSMVSLKPAMSASQGRSQIADALAGPGHRLLSRRPELVSHEFGLGAAPDLGRFPILGDFDAAQLVQVDFDAVVHPAEGGNGAMHAIVRQKGQVFLVGVFHLPPR